MGMPFLLKRATASRRTFLHWTAAFPVLVFPLQTTSSGEPGKGVGGRGQRTRMLGGSGWVAGLPGATRPQSNSDSISASPGACSLRPPTNRREYPRELQTRPAINTGHPFLDLCRPQAPPWLTSTPLSRAIIPNMEWERMPTRSTMVFRPRSSRPWRTPSRPGESTGELARLFRFWLGRFVKEDGRINYYGPSLSEYGQLLHTVTCLAGREEPGHRVGGRKASNPSIVSLSTYCDCARPLVKDGGSDSWSPGSGYTQGYGPLFP